MPTPEDHKDPTALLRPEERLISVQEVPATTPVEPLLPLQALQLLAGVEKTEDIGKNGPVVASRALPANQDQPELRLYEAFFGRDSLITSYFLLDHFPDLVKVTLLKLAALQGSTTNPASEEEPGRIVHEARTSEDPIAKKLTATRGWQWPYYGSVDATPLFIVVLADYARRHNQDFLAEEYVDRTGTTRPVRHAVEQAGQWIKTKMASNPEGLVESLRSNKSGGTTIQSWKDSPDSHHHADGSLANTQQGIASLEVQGYVYDALLAAGELLHHDFSREAKLLRATILQAFWVEDERGSYFALGSDRDDDGRLRPLKVRASNMGHLLTSHVLDGDEAAIVAKRDNVVRELFSPSLLDPSGIRTLATDANRFRPASYHNGSVWPWENYYISLGLRRHGFTEEASDLHRRIQHVLETTKRFPEFVAGGNSPEPLLPSRVIRVLDTHYKFEHVIEQPPQEIQAWTVAAAVAIEYNRKKTAAER